MEYFFYCRDKPGSGALRRRLAEAHWSFMDGYAGRMIARGPTLAEDGVTATGSMHVVDLPDPEAARVFAFEEPNYRAGVYAEVLVRRWRNLLGRSMWEFAGGGEDGCRFLVIGHGRPDAGAGPETPEASLVATAAVRRSLIVCGPLLSEDGSSWLGTTFAVELPSRHRVEELVTDGPLAGDELYERVEIHRWRFGGRPQS